MPKLPPDQSEPLPLVSDQSVAARLEAEFRASPGMRLTEAQIGRLFMLDAASCAAVLTALTDAGVLRKDASGRYCKA